VASAIQPGHAPGHQSFLITLPKTGSIILTIDAAYTLDHWEEKALPGFLASTVDTVRSGAKTASGGAANCGHDCHRPRPGCLAEVQESAGIL
jgi:glyoxylase-like metal-dependent hydrolase (beta-lactamase superfamily II)